MSRYSIYHQSPLKAQYRKENIKNRTEAELYLWKFLSNRSDKRLKNNVFAQQKIVCGYILDFYSSYSRLDIELNGEHHQFNPKQMEHDRIRQMVLNNNGIYVVRFSNFDVLRNTESVIDSISKKLKRRP